MYSVNRSIPPALQPITELYLHQPEPLHLDNQIPAFLFNTEIQDVAYIKLVFEAGKWQEPQQLVAKFTNDMLEEGTENHTSRQLAEKIEFYGANLSFQTGYNHAEVNLSCLTKHLPGLLPLLQEILTVANFPQEELDTEIRKAKQRLEINRQKNEYLADERLKTVLFGPEHPYGYPSSEAAIDAIHPEILSRFYRTHYTPENCKAYIGGKFSEEHLHLINQYIGSRHWKNEAAQTAKVVSLPEYQPVVQYISKPNSMQAAIRIGKHLVNKNHPDYQQLLLVNTLFGGYFGSRLMSNIREDKGYTYGIYSALISMPNAGVLTIGTEVNQNVWEQAVQEIFYEIDRLKNEPVSEQELFTVKNYMLGQLLSQISGTYSQLSTIQGLFMYGLGTDYYKQLVQTIQSMTPSDIMQIAGKYYQTGDFSQVVVGD
ncbi:MAG: insulinase family protein [Sphingobacteriales bacterium]|nr:MAG: insulinase family protein [Sphingobacteriales bacterium]